jgi:hypothetical protein
MLGRTNYEDAFVGQHPALANSNFAEVGISARNLTPSLMLTRLINLLSGRQSAVNFGIQV